MEEKSISDANNITAYTFSHTFNTQRDNTNTIFTSEKLDKPDNLADALKDLTINNTGYYESDISTAGDAKGDLTHNLKTVTHTSNRTEKVTDTSSGNFEQKI